MKMHGLILVALTAAALAGCSHTREFARQKLDDGTVSEWVTVQETALGIMSPSVKTVYRLNKKTGERQEIATVSGNGATGAALQAAGTWMGFKEIGDGLADSGDRNTINQSGGGASANTGPVNANANAANTVTPNPPPTPRPNWPPGHWKDRKPHNQDRRKW